MSHPARCTVLIAASELLPALKQSIGNEGGELIPFPDTEALRALETISRRRPRIVIVEQVFAATPRGAALINRIKADPTLSDTDVRVVSHERPQTRVVPRATSGDRAASRPAEAKAVGAVPTPPLDQRGTRRAPRSQISGAVDVVADGNSATLVDLSTMGAQVLSAVILKPNQRLRMTIADEHGTIRLNGTVAWAAFEIPPKIGPRYRAGIEFIDGDTAALERFCRRHES